ncbi:hypothetical protein NPIL_62641 [Nephila pilipes]|uniref:Uncharacterized protein n=1 Tax=Nephila pilipes TaxID=299642 RepID=A0A8X6T851_NEPPI|nr:hypothetical protein NPIL_62641 [Nephila pilipes]
MSKHRRWPATDRPNYINILIYGAPDCGVTRLIENIMSHCNDVRIHKEFNSGTMACQVPFQLDGCLFHLRICDLSRTTRLANESNDVMVLKYEIDVVIYCYSIDDNDSLTHLINVLNERDNVDDLPSVLVGNKLDLRNRWEIVQRSNEGRASFVSHQKAANFAEEFALSWLVECSAETGQSVREVLEAAVYSFCGKKGKRKMLEP